MTTDSVNGMEEFARIHPRSGLPEDKQEQINAVEYQEWLESLDYVLDDAGHAHAAQLLELLDHHAYFRGVPVEYQQNEPYINTIGVEEQSQHPGDIELEKRLCNLMRWNSVMMVMAANRRSPGIGGHLSSYTSACEIIETGINHFFRGHDHGSDRDLVFFQGHCSPGVYARSFLEGRIDSEQVANFRRELQPGSGLSSYPHPWLMSDYWEFPTVSMGLGPMQAIYQARLIRYLENRGLKEKSDSHVWAFVGDGEMDEPQSVGGLRFAAYEKLDNLVFVLNANLQRLDGPVRSNGKVIQEFDALFRGAGWNVIKVIWGSKWDELLAQDTEGELVRRFEKLVDGESQRYAAFGGKELREQFFNTPRLKALIENWTDDDLEELNRGGHDLNKVYAAYKAAMDHKGSPTVIITRTVKGYGLGSGAEALNVAHNVKTLDFEALKKLRDTLEIPLSDEQVENLELYHPGEDAPEIRYMRQRRSELGGLIPQRKVDYVTPDVPGEDFYHYFDQGSNGREVSTTMAAVAVISKLLRDKNIGDYIVPIVPDEARTFGMDALFSRISIYSPRGQRYKPVDADTLMAYKEATDGQFLQEGITEDGAMASWIAAGTAYANHSLPMIPFYVLYSMFGMQRIGDMVWAAADQMAKGFILGATAGRTTLNGEGLQHQDGNSHLQGYVVPNMRCYDPAFGYELAAIIEHGIDSMYVQNNDEFYYITIDNENEIQPAMPVDGRSRAEICEGIIKGMYLYQPGPGSESLGATGQRNVYEANLLASGPAMGAALEAVELLKEYGVSSNVFSVTSYKALHQDALETQRWNMLHPTQEPRISHIASELTNVEGVVVSVSDYVALGADGLNGHIDRKLWVLGTDGFGRSEGRAELRDHFEVDAKYVVLNTLYALNQQGDLSADVVARAIENLGIDTERKSPVQA